MSFSWLAFLMRTAGNKVWTNSNLNRCDLCGKIRFKIPLYTSYSYLRLERKKRRQRHVVRLKLQRNGGNNDFWKLSFCRDTLRFCQKKKKPQRHRKKGIPPTNQVLLFWPFINDHDIVWICIKKFPNFIISTNYTGTLDTPACVLNNWVMRLAKKTRKNLRASNSCPMVVSGSLVRY